MTNKVKCMQIIKFLGKKSDWEKLVQGVLLHGQWKGYKKLLVSRGSTSDMDKIPTQDEYENAIEGDTDLKKIIKLGELHELAYKE